MFLVNKVIQNIFLHTKKMLFSLQALDPISTPVLCTVPPPPCILQKCVIAEWPGWFVLEKRLKVVKWPKKIKYLKITQTGQIPKCPENDQNLKSHSK